MDILHIQNECIVFSLVDGSVREKTNQVVFITKVVMFNDVRFGSY